MSLIHKRCLVAVLSCVLVSGVLAGDADFEIDEPEVTEFDRDHWAFKPIHAPDVPTVKNRSWPKTEIDCFVLSKLESLKPALAPHTDADRRTLARRLHLDLLGLPPTRFAVDEFVQDQRPGAYPRLVERVLASPDYGVRWGQHWLDLARFAETDGFEHDKFRANAWKYRDWVIDALNSDMPFDQFVRWQVAGDLIEPDNNDAITATAFCVSGPDMPDINSQDERRHVLLNEMTSTVGEVFLSLQIGCAQCHDHKFDPISQADFYRLRAFFEPAIRVVRYKPVPTLISTSSAAESHLMVRGDWRRKGPKLAANVPRVIGEYDATDSPSTRVDLADWLVDPSNPITARSIVNRIWQHHFGRGLVDSPSDFGVMGSEPTHPELLDFLASRLIDGSWSIKRLHREILLSHVYQTQSTHPAASEQDPDNKLLRYFPRRRLEGEAIRDSMIVVSGLLNQTLGGKGVSPPLPEEMIKTLKNNQWKTSPNQRDHYRRSVYLFARRNLRYPFLATFDRPTADRPCASRSTSTTAVQSLYLMNSELTFKAAKNLADLLASDSKSPEGQVRSLFARALAREPSATELQGCVQFVADEETELVDLCRAILNCNEFAYIE